MIKQAFKETTRDNKTISTTSDLIVVGGGMAGVCTAIAAARAGIKVTLVQDRPVLGGNASSEVRLWVLGATSHMGNNNRWAREGGIIDEVLVENTFRNKEGNTIIFDTILLEKVTNETNITLLLNTSVFEVLKSNATTIRQVNAFCSQNSTMYHLKAALFCDASGDGIVGFQAGAAFRIGAESKEEFGELFAPDISYGELLGHTIYFYSKDTGKPVDFVAPEFALKDITKIPRYKNIGYNDSGCRLWWLEYGGRKDTIHDSEEIKWELWKVVYGVWDYIKNSGSFPEAENLTLEWVGTIPGKRESRRFEGLYMMKQQDIVEQKKFEDAIAFGGWAVDLHPADGVYDSRPGCTQYHSKGIYQIPLRSLISKNIDNLFLGGRIMSATHVAFGSTRVMATTAHYGQAIGYGAAQCIKNKVLPADLIQNKEIKELQQTLNINGQSIPETSINQQFNLANTATIEASSVFKLKALKPSGIWQKLTNGIAQLLPLKADTKYEYIFQFLAECDTSITVQLRTSERTGYYTPDTIIEHQNIQLSKGEQNISFVFDAVLDQDQYAFIAILRNENVSYQISEERVTGILSVFNSENKAVNNIGKQSPPENSGLDAFEFWIPLRRPKGENLAFKITPEITDFGTENLTNGFVRPYLKANAWAATKEDKTPELILSWDETQTINEIKLFLDTDYDHPMESSLMGHPEARMPFCVEHIQVFDEDETLLFSVINNHQTIVQHQFDMPIKTKKIYIKMESKVTHIPVSVFEIQIR
ncbi:FAD-dependent oxidoreductase [uncultured Algibacter sp.]|uniref:FAD-dependent oxidoreductase n=1 Tax=uncultured Algibacter sp. TaxID=298659 RepID=UPI00262C4918|nr:FAD-dependent oxidoreductase [uncultured Algibacter sp.]